MPKRKQTNSAGLLISQESVDKFYSRCATNCVKAATLFLKCNKKSLKRSQFDRLRSIRLDGSNGIKIAIKPKQATVGHQSTRRNFYYGPQQNHYYRRNNRGASQKSR
jgi:hypothetical protein